MADAPRPDDPSEPPAPAAPLPASSPPASSAPAASGPAASLVSAPAPLEYYSPVDPEHLRRRNAAAWWVVLLASWGPYFCGVVNAATVAQSYTPVIIREHRNAAVLLFATGLIMSIGSMVRFARMRHLAGAVAAAGVVAVQLSMVMCMGLAG